MVVKVVYSTCAVAVLLWLYTVSGVVVVVCLVVLHGLLVVHNVPGAELGSENKPVQFVILRPNSWT
jgi:hypothetical protein